MSVYCRIKFSKTIIVDEGSVPVIVTLNASATIGHRSEKLAAFTLPFNINVRMGAYKQ
jgi:hypothetical protein